ncbi:MAG: redoxin family protein [Chloroflexi bacterium]|nr:redoxin family protein [Chloroflexota bacterium]
MIRPKIWMPHRGVTAAFVTAAAVMLAACASSSPQTEVPDEVATVAPTTAPTAAPTLTPTPTDESAEGSAVAQAPTEPQAEDFRGIVQWLNSDPLTLEELQGRVVLIDFWTYSCINCLRTLPFLRDWHAKYANQGLTIVGVHSPEFNFEKDEANVREALIREQVAWPVAMDNDFATWRAYRNRWWPNKFLIDQDGIVRYNHIGEGAYEETEHQIRALLTEAGYDVSGIPVGAVVVEEAPDIAMTREIFMGRGWAFGLYLGNAEEVWVGDLTSFTDSGERAPGKFYLQGHWTADRESIQHGRTTEGLEDYITIEYQAASVNGVMSPAGTEPFAVDVTIDGEPVAEALRGDDTQVDEAGRTFVLVDANRLYNIIRSAEVGRHVLRLASDSKDFVFYTYTFGS